MSSRECLFDFCRSDLSGGTSRPTDGDSLLVGGEIVVFQLRVSAVAVSFGLVVLLAKYEVLTTLPLRRHPWQEAGVLLLPAVVLIFTVGDFEARLA